ncbi:hypothetical protein CPT03_03300 [Pedobacter ginsengisoli]|uniref:Uncharacterized protein n=1 Tax=Pedobacter ginsengisoli TaxID=363852 RepID=A0A2D1U1S1_9SPHI|nr:hypothetical protein [Pedobacter ginsengisoli]ATP55557.1 hypothetical protein CPT03_03300 [Pedobacter ginsengisoli]
MTIDKKEAGISALKMLFSTIPYAGQLLNEIIFDYRGRIKQNRLNNFTELLSDFFNIHPDIDLENLKSEDFSDVFELVIIKVANTKSLAKQKRFRDILTHHILYPRSSTDNAEIYLQLVAELNETAINILSQYQRFSIESQKISQQLQELDKRRQCLASYHTNITSDQLDEQNQRQIEEQIVDIDKQIEALNTYNESIQDFKKAEFYQITEGEFLYNKQMLSAKALLVDNGMSYFDIKPFQAMSITEFGDLFIRFILN